MSDNPYEPGRATSSPHRPDDEDVSSGRAAYNIVSDTVTGLNMRWSDNRWQLVFAGVSAGIFAVTGVLLAILNPRWELPWWGGAMLGALAGAVAGVFASGIFLMVYRAQRHIRGKHD